MIQNFSSWECEVCVRENNLTHYTVNNLTPLYSVLDFPKPCKKIVDAIYYDHVTVPLHGDLDEVDTIMEIRHTMGTFSHIDFHVTCSDSNYTDWKSDWEVVKEQSIWPKFRVYIYGVNDFLHNHITFSITAIVKLSEKE